MRGKNLSKKGDNNIRPLYNFLFKKILFKYVGMYF